MHVKLRAVDGIVKLNSLTGTVHGGALDVKATFNAKHSTAKLTSKGSLKAMDIAQALKAVGSDPIATGKANLEWRLNSSGKTSNQLVSAMKLNSSGKTSNQLVSAMKGPIDLLTTKVVLQDIGIEKMLCEAVALANRESLSTALTRVKFK